MIRMHPNPSTGAISLPQVSHWAERDNQGWRTVVGKVNQQRLRAESRCLLLNEGDCTRDT
jgi:hypothetical protein